MGKVYFGLASASPPNFAGDQVQLLFAGSGTYTTSIGGGSTTSDWATLAQTFDNTKTYVASIFIGSSAGYNDTQFGSISNVDLCSDTSTGVDHSGDTTPPALGTSANFDSALQKVEIQSGAATALTASSLTDAAPTLGAPTVSAISSTPIFFVGNQVLDGGLIAFTGATALHVCSAAINQYSDVATNTLGNSTALGWTGPAAASPTGRKITLNATSAGSLTGSGTVVSWAIIDSGNSRLLATGPLAASAGATAGHSFSLDAIAIHYPQ
jgi:hypothetical protein